MLASRSGHEEVVGILIKNGADIHQKDYDGWTALMKASFRGHKEVVEFLIQKGADVNAKSVTGDTALIIAKDEKTKKAIIDAVKKRNEKTEENVIVQGIERE
jgi:ankyrin repeat protein